MEGGILTGRKLAITVEDTMGIIESLSDIDAFLLAHVEGGEEDCGAVEAPRVIKVKVEKPAKVAKVAKESRIAAPALPVPMCEPSAETAATFIMTIRRAGFRQANNTDGTPRVNDKGEPVMFCDQSKVKQDSIEAVATFIGYDVKKGALPYGSQLSNALNRATFLTRPSLGGEGKVRKGLTGTPVTFGSAAVGAEDRYVASLKGKRVALLDAAKKMEKVGNVLLANTALAGARKLSEELSKYGVL